MSQINLRMVSSGRKQRRLNYNLLRLRYVLKLLRMKSAFLPISSIISGIFWLLKNSVTLGCSSIFLMTDFHIFSMESYSVDSMGSILLISSILKMLRTVINLDWEVLKAVSIFLPLMSQVSQSVSIWTSALEKGEFLRMRVLVRWCSMASICWSRKGWLMKMMFSSLAWQSAKSSLDQYSNISCFSFSISNSFAAWFEIDISTFRFFQYSQSSFILPQLSSLRSYPAKGSLLLKRLQCLSLRPGLLKILMIGTCCTRNSFTSFCRSQTILSPAKFLSLVMSLVILLSMLITLASLFSMSKWLSSMYFHSLMQESYSATSCHSQQLGQTTFQSSMALVKVVVAHLRSSSSLLRAFWVYRLQSTLAWYSPRTVRYSEQSLRISNVSILELTSLSQARVWFWNLLVLSLSFFSSSLRSSTSLLELRMSWYYSSPQDCLHMQVDLVSSRFPVKPSTVNRLITSLYLLSISLRMSAISLWVMCWMSLARVTNWVVEETLLETNCMLLLIFPRTSELWCLSRSSTLSNSILLSDLRKRVSLRFSSMQSTTTMSTLQQQLTSKIFPQQASISASLALSSSILKGYLHHCMIPSLSLNTAYSLLSYSLKAIILRQLRWTISLRWALACMRRVSLGSMPQMKSQVVSLRQFYTLGTFLVSSMIWSMMSHSSWLNTLSMSSMKVMVSAYSVMLIMRRLADSALGLGWVNSLVMLLRVVQMSSLSLLDMMMWMELKNCLSFWQFSCFRLICSSIRVAIFLAQPSQRNKQASLSWLVFLFMQQSMLQGRYSPSLLRLKISREASFSFSRYILLRQSGNRM